jgi:hypothetical protein
MHTAALPQKPNCVHLQHLQYGIVTKVEQPNKKVPLKIGVHLSSIKEKESRHETATQAYAMR